ncbi:MAG: helix-turn-helix transcriptional regulator [Actinobacteria bacterium]|nr:helix-turn-helix transcriptional regulator [Actinomycetota bacterium]
MTKPERLKVRQELLREHLRNSSFRARWENTALARAVALRLVGYRAQHRLTQTALAAKLGMQQPAVARLEAGDKNPTWETIARISRALGIEFLVNIAPPGRRRLMGGRVEHAEVVETVATDTGRITIAAS